MDDILSHCLIFTVHDWLPSRMVFVNAVTFHAVNTAVTFHAVITAITWLSVIRPPAVFGDDAEFETLVFLSGLLQH